MANVKLVYINGTGGYVQSTSTADVAQSIGKIELTGVGGVALDAGAAKLANLGTPTLSGDAATKGYVDAVAAGLTWVAPVVVVATTTVTLNGSQTIDSVTPANGARVLITGQNGTTADAANGIYIVNTSGAWTRASDTLQAGTAMFVTQGTSYADTQWVLATDTSPIVPGTTPIVFVQAGASVSYTAGSGINIVGTTISAKGDATKAINVDATNGIQVVADTNYGLSIDATTGLRVDLDTDPGLEFNGGNLRIKIASANELSLDSNGLNVEGVPTQFKIGASAVSTNVTATNLNALTDSSTVTSLHRHNAVIFGSTASLSLGQGYPVYADAANTVLNADAGISNNKAGVVGISLDNYTGGDPAFIQSHGVCSVFTGLTAGTAYYLPDSAGTPVAYSAITSGNRAIRIGYALNATTIQLQIQDMGVKP